MNSKKCFFIVAVLTAFSIQIKAQTPPVNWLDVNNIAAKVVVPGDMFTGSSNYRWPKDSMTSTIFSANFWLGGFDENEELRLMGQTYNSNDIYAGYPGATATGFYNRTWAVSLEEIEDFRADIADGSLDMPLPESIQNWPAIGNPNLETAGVPVVIDRELAPFIDMNHDGIYVPADGDYPQIKGEKMLWWVFHDDRVHLESGGERLKVEVQCSFYAYGCGEESPIYNTTFLEYKIISHNDGPLTGVKAGLFNDFDLGCFRDDFIGSIPDLDAHYVYNTDIVDGHSACSFVEVYGEGVPVQSKIILSHPLISFMYFNNPAGDAPFGTIDPQVPEEFYRYLNATWRDGAPLREGWDGYDTFGDSTLFAFPDEPANEEGWSQCTNLLAEFDRRSLAATDLGTLIPGEPVTLRTAWVTTPPVALPCPILEEVRSDLEVVKAHEEDGWFELTNEIWPTDTIELTASPFLELPQNGTYLWSNGSTEHFIQMTASGSVSVEVTSPWGCTQADEVYVEFLVNSTEEKDVRPIFNIFPNPVGKGGVLTVKAEAANLELLEIFDTAGKQRLAHDFSHGNEVPLGTLPAGIYLAKIKIDGSQVWEKITVAK